jgi:hypothetical protein
MREKEKKLKSLKILFPFLKNKFIEFQDSLSVVMADWDKRKVQLVHLGEKVV